MDLEVAVNIESGAGKDKMNRAETRSSWAAVDG